MALAAMPASAVTYTVTNTSDGGTGSFRDAILAANANCGADPTPVIAFNLPGPFTISPSSELPHFGCPSGAYSPVVDGYTQPGSSPNSLATGFNANILIDLTGASSSGFYGLAIDDYGYGGALTVKGLIVRDFTYGGSGSGLYGQVLALGNRITGNNVGIRAHDGSVIGGSLATDRNVIGNNSSSGIEVSYGAQITVTNNYIGTLDGNNAAPNGVGLNLPGAYFPTIDGNVVSGNGNNGMYLSSSFAQVTNNTVGMNAAGTAALPNNGAGIYLQSAYGGTVSGNYISGNAFDGITIWSSTAVTIADNWIGTNASGTAPIPNMLGIYADCSQDLVFQDNVVSGNVSDGISLGGVTATLPGNSKIYLGGIGVAPDLTTPMPNGGNGVTLSSGECGTSNFLIDGALIAYNGANGVHVTGSVGNRIVAQGIFANALKNIDLDMVGGPLPNDPGDIDIGPNNRQNYPEITAVTQYPGNMWVDFTLDSTPDRSFDIAAYCNDTLGAPAGKTFMGTASFFQATGATAGGMGFGGSCNYVSLLAIDTVTGDTSEFSPMVAAVPAPTPAVNVSTTSLNFGNVGIGSTSASLTSTMTSTGTAAWQLYYIGSPSCYGGPICYGGAEFTCSTTCVSDFQAAATKSATKAYLPGQSCSLTASFSPTFTGPQSTTVQFCGNTAPITITLTGNGVVPAPFTISPTSHDFGLVPVGSSAGPITFTVSNPGTTPLSIGAPLSSGPFTLGTTTCGLSIPALGACEVNVTFLPTGAGLATGQLAILPTSGSPVYASLMGTGTVVAELLLPSSVEFSYTVGSTSPSVQVVTIKNTGLAPLSISSITLTGAKFTLAQDCPGTLAPGASCLVTLGFSASEPGVYTGQLAVVTNAPGGSAIIGLRGLAQPRPVPILELSPREIGFGARGFGSLGPPQKVTIRNVGGAPAAFTSFTVSPDFVILNNSCGPALESLATCETMVAMRPVGYGQRFGTFTVNSNAENGPNSTALFGSGCRLTGLSIGRLGRISSCGP